MAQIRQAYVSWHLRFFKPYFLSKYDLQPYHNPDEPSLFYGCYSGEDRKALYEHRSLAVVLWAGTDATVAKNFEFFPLLTRQSHNPICFLATSSYIAADMQAHNLPYLSRPITPIDGSPFTPKPLGDKVYFYCGTPEYRDKYGYAYLQELKQRLPQVPFLEHYNNTVPHDQMPGIYEQCALGARLLTHDGLGTTMVELGLMGRKCIWNGDFVSAVAWDSMDSVVETIGRELARAGQTDTELARQVQQAISVTDWLDTDCYDESVRYYGNPSLGTP